MALKFSERQEITRQLKEFFEVSGGGISITNDVANRLLTAGGDGQSVIGQVNLTFNGTQLDLTGNAVVTTNAASNAPILDVFNSSTSSSAKPMIRVGNNAAAALELYRVGDSSTTYINANQSGNGVLTLQTDTSSRLTIESSGNIGFYDSTSTTTDFYWDAANSKLGIVSDGGSALTSPKTSLDVRGSLTLGEATSDAILDTNEFGKIEFYSYDISTNSSGVTSKIVNIATSDFSATNNDHRLGFFINDGLTTTGTLQERLSILQNGSVGIGVTPEAGWRTSLGDKVLQLGNRTALYSDSNLSTVLSNNVYVNQTPNEYRRLEADYVSQYIQYQGIHTFQVGGTGTADSQITSFTDAMVITETGRVGIGTDNPGLGNMLDVNQATGGTANYIRVRSASHGSARLGVDGSGARVQQADLVGGCLYFQMINGTAMVIDCTLNVGIGEAVPASLLTLKGGNILLEYNSTGADDGHGIFFHTTTSGWSEAGSHGAIYGKRVDASNGYLRFDTRSGGTTDERMRLDENGNLGIGTDSPTASLTVAGPNTATSLSSDNPLTIMDGNADNEFVTLKFQTGAGGSLAFIGAKATTTGVYPNAVGQLHFAIQNGSGRLDAMVIDENRRVGIGTESPGAPLDVRGGNVRIDGGSVTDRNLYFRNQSTGTVGGSVRSDQTLSLFAGVGGAPTQAVTIERQTLYTGIGIDNPTHRLHVNESTGAILRLQGCLNYNYDVTTKSTGYHFDHEIGSANATFSWSSSSAGEMMRIDQTGLGVGTDDINTKLHISGDFDASPNYGATNPNKGILIEKRSGIASDYSIDDAFGIDFTSSSNAAATYSVAGIYAVTKDAASALGGELHLLTRCNTDGALQLRMMIARGGNVGIGTDVPTHKLSLSTTGTDGIKLGVDSQTYYHVIRPNGDGLYIGADDGNTGGTGADIRFNVEGSEHMRITSNGNIGINNISPSTNAVIHAVATNFTGSSGAIILEDKRTDANPYVRIENDARAYNLQTVGVRSDNFEILDSTAGSVRLTITSGGDVKTTNLAFVGSSIENYTTANDSGNVWVNYEGYEGGTTYFRDFKIGNGKQSTIAFFDGSTSRFGLGIDVPSVPFHLVTTNTGAASIFDAQGNNNVSYARYQNDQDSYIEVSHYGSARSDTFAGISLANYSLIKTAGTHNGLIIGTNGSDPMVFATNNSERIRITSDGYVGIGCTSPTSKLHAYSKCGSNTTGNNISTDFAQPAASGAVTCFCRNLWFGSKTVCLPAAVTDSGYRIGIQIEHYINTSAFAGVLKDSKAIWSRVGTYTGATGRICCASAVHAEVLISGNTTINKPYGFFQTINLADGATESTANVKNYFQSRIVQGPTCDAPAACLYVAGTSSPTVAGWIARFDGGTTTPYCNRYMLLNNTYTGSSYDALPIVWQTNSNTNNCKSHAAIYVSSDGTMAFRNASSNPSELGTSTSIISCTSERMRISGDGKIMVSSGLAPRGTVFYENAHTANVQVEGTQPCDSSIAIIRNNASFGPNLIFARSKGTTGSSNTIVGVDENLGGVNAQAADGVQFVQAAAIGFNTGDTVGRATGTCMSGEILFYTNNGTCGCGVAERMRLKKNGALGIGTGSSVDVASLLHIKSGGNAKMTIESVDTNQNWINFAGSTVGMSFGFHPGNNRFQWGSGDTITSTPIACLDQSGNFTAAGDITSSSDCRLKSSITSIDCAIFIVNSLCGRRYIKDDKPSIGVVAQEIESVLPEVVHGGDKEDDFKSVSYGNITAVLIEAIKEQQKQIDYLKEEINILKSSG